MNQQFAELGKAKTYPHDFPGLGALDRSLEAIKDAARKIEQAEGRLLRRRGKTRGGLP